MKRISAMEVWAAYVVTGLKPAQGKFYPTPDSACGLGVVARAADQNVTLMGICPCLDVFSLSYIGGFASGFDGLLFRRPLSTHNPDEFYQGLRDGRRAWIFCSQLYTATQNPTPRRKTISLTTPKRELQLV